MNYRNLPHFIAASFIGFGAGTAHAGLDIFKPFSVGDEIQKQIAKTKVSQTVNLHTPILFDGLSAAIKYKIASEPSYQTGVYTRIDAYTLEADLNPGNLLDSLDIGVYFRMHKGADIIFARQFPTQLGSITALPYTALNFPINSARAKERLKVGDFVAFQTDLNLIVEASTSSIITKEVVASASTHYLVSGNFWVHMFKMSDEKIRVKFIAFRNQETGAGAGIDLGKGLRVLGLKITSNKQIEKLIRFDPLNISMSKNDADLFMLDYVFDLKDKTASELYDNMMNSKLTLREFKLANPLNDADDLKKDLVKDITDIEKLRREDLNLPISQRRIDRVFMGSNVSSGWSNHFAIGLNILRFENDLSFAENKIASVNRNDTEEKFLLDTMSAFEKSKSLFGLWDEEQNTSTASVLFSASENFDPTRFVTMTMAREMKMARLQKHDYAQVQNYVSRVLPSRLFNQIDWKNWYTNGTPIVGYFRHDIYIQPKAIGFLKIANVEELKNRIRKIVHTKPYPTATPTPNPFGQGDQPDANNESYGYDIPIIANGLMTIANPKASVQQRYQSFSSLKTNSLWREIGGGLILSMLPQERFEELVGYDLTFVAKDREPIRFQVGDLTQDELFRSIQYIQNALNNRSFDLRLYVNQKGEYTLKAPL